MNKTKNYLIASAIIAMVVFTGYAIWIIAKPVPLEIQGEVEATQIKVASKLMGRIDSIMYHKGDDVNAGSILFTITSPELDARYLQASAVRNAARFQKEKADNGAMKEDIQAAFNSWQTALTSSDLAKKTFQRVYNLFKSGVVAEQQKDEAEARMNIAVETENAARSLYEKARKGARYEDKGSADALVAQAEGVIIEVNSYLSETRIAAPIAGEIANIISERGELVPAGYPVVTIVDLNDVWVTFNLRENLLASIHKGSTFVARFPALGMKEIMLKVTYITALGEFATWNATKTSGDFDVKTFEVHAVPVEKTTGLMPGMSALVNWDEVGKTGI